LGAALGAAAKAAGKRLAVKAGRKAASSQGGKAAVLLAGAGMLAIVVLPFLVVGVAVLGVVAAVAGFFNGDGGTANPATPFIQDFGDAVAQCGNPAMTGSLLAAQIQVETGWATNTETGESGVLINVDDAWWETNGIDGDGDDLADMSNPRDQIATLGQVMCENLAWAQTGIDNGTLDGEVVDLALAAWVTSRQEVIEAGGVQLIVKQRYVELVLLTQEQFLWLDLGLDASDFTATGGVGVASGEWVHPAPGAHLLWGFGPRWGRQHWGLDYIQPCGTPLVAVGDGEVVFTGWSGGFGNLVKIRHSDGSGDVTYYAHISHGGTVVKTGDQVVAGQTIAYTGTTGNSQGCHLHFEVHPGGRTAIDPEPWLIQKGIKP
jgi:hypothetical protein